MKTLKGIYLTFLRLLQQTRQLPQTIGNFSRQQREQHVLEELEAERLDRIRNPSKYRGK
jgi:hypothetical protein